MVIGLVIWGVLMSFLLSWEVKHLFRSRYTPSHTARAHSALPLSAGYRVYLELANGKQELLQVCESTELAHAVAEEYAREWHTTADGIIYYDIIKHETGTFSRQV